MGALLWTYKGSLVWTWEVWQLVWMNFDEGTPVTLRDLGPRVLDSLEPYDNLQVYEVSFQGKNQGEQLSMSLTPELVCALVVFSLRVQRRSRNSQVAQVLTVLTVDTDTKKTKQRDKKTKQRTKRQNRETKDKIC